MRQHAAAALVGVVASVVIFLAICRASQPETTEAVPKFQIVAPGVVTEIWDGDTITCEVRFKARVRLLDCWAPELRDTGGLESRDNLKAFAEGKPCRLVIDLSDVDRLDDVLTFGRVLAHVWVDGKDLSSFQVVTGHALERRN